MFNLANPAAGGRLSGSEIGVRLSLGPAAHA
jgi:hypothetical protein